jgi:predicted small metal-binding protein
VKTIHCRDTGERTCNFTAEAKSIEEAERILLDHVQLRHPNLIVPSSLGYAEGYPE